MLDTATELALLLLALPTVLRDSELRAIKIEKPELHANVCKRLLDLRIAALTAA